MVATSCTHVLQPVVFDLNKYITVFFVKDIKQLDMVTAHIRREMVTPKAAERVFFLSPSMFRYSSKRRNSKKQGEGVGKKRGAYWLINETTNSSNVNVES